MKFTHQGLCEKMAQYLRYRAGFPVVCIEMHSGIKEIPDVYACCKAYSVVLEIKVSRSDFFKDAKKIHRKYPKNGIGNYRYFVCKENLIEPEEVPERWGLIYVTGDGNIKVIKGKSFNNRDYDTAYYFQPNFRNESIAMFALLRKAASWDLLNVGKNGVWKFSPRGDDSTDDPLLDAECISRTESELLQKIEESDMELDTDEEDDLEDAFLYNTSEDLYDEIEEAADIEFEEDILDTYYEEFEVFDDIILAIEFEEDWFNYELEEEYNC